MSPAEPIPLEVELAFELMPCQALRVAQEPADAPHPCSYFRRWGTYHSFDYRHGGAPSVPHVSTATYLGRAALTAEMLTGCRKAPILAIGINPNLPGWWPALRGSLNPWFDDLQQYAHYFRFRGAAKPELSGTDYDHYRAGHRDTPPTSRVSLDVPKDGAGQRTVRVHWRTQKMYQAYQELLDELAKSMVWPPGQLAVGEDLSYANMVGCPSAKWTTHPDPSDP